MKKLFLGVALALGIVLPAKADDDVCMAFEVAAAAILEAKNTGVPMSSVMDIAEKSSKNMFVRRLMRALVMDAYNLPAMASKEAQRRQATQFIHEVASTCYRTLDEAGFLD